MSRAVTISILTYKRHQHLRRALASALQYADQVAEIIVVDNAAEPELKALLAAEYPNVRYIAAESNAGCEGRNIGLRAAATPIVITIDDDVELSSSNCIAEVENAFSRDPQLACLNFTVTGVDGKVLERDWCHPRPISHASREFETHFILEGASALSREKVLSVGGYPAEFFLGHEGVDLGYRLIGRRLPRHAHAARIDHASCRDRASSRLARVLLLHEKRNLGCVPIVPAGDGDYAGACLSRHDGIFFVARDAGSGVSARMRRRGARVVANGSLATSTPTR